MAITVRQPVSSVDYKSGRLLSLVQVTRDSLRSEVLAASPGEFSLQSLDPVTAVGIVNRKTIPACHRQFEGKFLEFVRQRKPAACRNASSSAAFG
jgi:hypothetical protein